MEEYDFGGIKFNKQLYRKLITEYSETFTHTSLSIENEYIKLEEYEKRENQILKEEIPNYNYLSVKEKRKMEKKYRFFVTYMAYSKGMIPKINFENEEEINKIYEERFKEFDLFMPRLIVFDKNGRFIEHKTGRNVSMFFPLHIEKKWIEKTVEKARLDHTNAFMYASNLETIRIKDILKINELVNESNPNKQIGFKKINNTIIGADFKTIKKEEAPIQLAELVYKYNHNFDMDIKNPNEENISQEEKYKRLFLICLKEAIFHIKFEHIHPFSDGNGRTGRIILCTNLMRQKIAPPLITRAMLEQYKDFIKNNDYKGLAQMILNSSSQTLSTWVTTKREKEHLPIGSVLTLKL